MDVSEIKEQLKSAFKNFITNKVENEKWITIHPHGEESEDYRRLKLEDGESPKEAIDRVYKKEDKKENKQSDTKEENKDKYIGKKFFIGDREDEITEYLPQFDRYMGKNPEGLNWGAQLYTKEDLDKYYIKSDEEYLKEKELREKQKVERERAQKQKEEEEKVAQAEYMRDNGFTEGMTDLQKGKTLKDLNKEVWYKQVNDGKPTTSKKMIEELIGKGFKPKEETFRTSKKINGERIDKDTVSKILEDKDGNFYKLNSTEYKYAQYLQDKGKETSDSPFGEGVEVIESDKKGYMVDSKNLKSYKKGDKFAIVDDWSHDDKDRYTVSFHDGKKTLDRKTYSTKRGMEKAIREHLQGGPNKETKALETKSNLEEKENTYKEVLQRYKENDRKRWSSGLSNEEYHKAWTEAEKAKKELTTARREYAESIMANFEKSDNTYYEDKQNARRERYEELSEKASRESEQAHQAFRDKMSAIPMGQPILVGHYSEQRDRRYRERAWDTLGKAVKLSDKADYYESKANSVGKAGISADDANAIAKLAQKYKSGVTSAEKRRIIDRVIDIHKNRQMAGDTSKQTDYSNLGFQVERNTDINRLQLKFDGKPEANVRSILKSNGFRWSPREGAWQRQLGGNSEGGLNRVVEQLKNINNSLLMGLDEILQQEPITAQDSKIINCINNILDPVINNSKEQDMALIEELKKLITKVENTKGEEEMEIENEKVDKRKLIDEVGGILKGKVDDEVIRTIIGKMEKMSYDDSEASADNKKVKNEADEEDKKVDNEEDKKEDNKVDNGDEEDEEKVEELKKEEKKDVDNKCKNSKEENYFDKLNKIYNSAKKIEEPSADYESKQARLEAGKEYFG